MKISILVKKIKQGNIFIYPTDTTYGIGCNASNKKSVAKLKRLKGRDAKKPLSIIAPSKKWIFEHCKVDRKLVSKYLPGKYTLIVRKKNKQFLSHVSNSETIGIRIPKHWFTRYIQKAHVPFVTTSANMSGKKPARKIEDVGKLLEKADVLVNGGTLSGKPSTIILENGKLLKR